MNFPSWTPESWFTLLADDLQEVHLYIHPPLCLSTCLLVAVYEYRTHTLSLYIHSFVMNTRIIALDTKISNMGWLDFRLLQPPISKLALPVTSMLPCVILFPLSQPKNSTISISCSISVVSSDGKRSLTWVWRKSDRPFMYWFLCTSYDHSKNSSITWGLVVLTSWDKISMEHQEDPSRWKHVAQDDICTWYTNFP